MVVVVVVVVVVVIGFIVIIDVQVVASGASRSICELCVLMCVWACDRL